MTGINIKEINKGGTLALSSEDQDLLTFLWNTGKPSNLYIDGNEILINTNCVVFLSELYMEVNFTFSECRIITFKKDFLSPISTLKTIGDFLTLFYGPHSVGHVPKIALKSPELEEIQEIWSKLQQEYTNINNPVYEALLRNSFIRILLIIQKVHMETEFDIPLDFKDLKRIREFQYLVNQNFKELTKVSDYAKIMDISSKKISEIFGCCYDKKASELISDRRNLYAKRQLRYTNELIKNIAYDLNFSDSQSFSHFFKKHNEITPEEYRNSI
jgi:AraC family transcriptional activator of pobA